MTTIGSLNVELTLGNEEFVRRMRESRGVVADFAREAQAQLSRLGDMIRNIGAGLTAGVTVPYAGLMAVSVRGAANFEAAMNRVNASMRELNPQQLREMNLLARELGPQVGMGATQAAAGIESLALAGMNAATIVNGGLRSALVLAVANMGEVDAAGSMVQNTLTNFRLTAEDLPMVVNRITGALDNSQFGFEDFRLGLAQAGAVANGAGVSFEDFTTALAATSAAFASGSDAGTSFKTYLQSLTPNSKAARNAMRELGISFFDAQGRLKPLVEQAEMLQRATANLSDRRRSRLLEEIFGADAGRTALALAQAGRKEIERIDAALDRTDAGEKLAIQMRGLNGAVGRLKASFEELKIAIGETGLLDLVTRLVEGFSRMVSWIAHLNPTVLKFGVILGAVASLIGPLLLILKPLAIFILARIAAGMGLIYQAAAFLIAPIQTLVNLFGGLIARLAGGAALAGIGRAFTALTGPIGWAITAVILFWDNIKSAFGEIWAYAQETIGPPLRSIFEALGGIFNSVGGWLGPFVQLFVSAFNELREVVGEVVEFLLEGFGRSIVDIIGGALNMIAAVVRAIAALFRGDFAGAFREAGSFVDGFFQTIVNVFGNIFPPIRGPLQAIYNLLKAVFVDGLGTVVAGVRALIQVLVALFWNVVSGINSALGGVPGTIYRLIVSGFERAVGRARVLVGGLYALWQSVRQMMGLATNGPGAGDLVIGAARTIMNTTGQIAGRLPRPGAAAGGGGVDDGGGEEDGSGRRPRRGGGGMSAEERARRLEELKLEQELAVARAREDHDEVRRLERLLERNRLVKQYRDLNLSAGDAAAAADRDMAALDAARAVARERNLAISDQEHEIELARIMNARVTLRDLEEQRELRQEIERLQREGHSLEEASNKAQERAQEIQRARIAMWRDELAQRERMHELEVARLRGDRGRVRDLERAEEIRRRSEDLFNRGDGNISRADALALATREVDAETEARLVGTWRDTFREGVQAAMEGDFFGWLQDKWTDLWSSAMEEALNTIADALRELLRQVFANMGGGGEKGGLFGTILSGIAGLFGASGVAPKVLQSGDLGFVGGVTDPSKLPGFAGGGTMKILGNAGIDKNVLSMNGQPFARVGRDELMKVIPPGATDGSRVQIIPSPYFNVVVDGRAARVAAPIGKAAEVAGGNRGMSSVYKRAGRRLP
ncbi:MAG: phage tail tape measure protein [Allosphingosinicella sp.]